ncbi:MAG: YifB family Mg chelatase-like AAA ATPase [Lachnospiraceae bacterium]|nr:YifB family Mg chelatase-like AAA ATPase [Lachnospiraceae bacterium]
MFCKVYCADICGIDAQKICVEADVSGGLPAFTMVGLPSSEVKESRERVLRAISNSGIDLPPRKITINLAPASLRKSGSGFDLPIACAILAASGFLNTEMLKDIMIVGELGLDGSINPIRGILPIAIKAREEGFQTLVVPEKNAMEGSAITDLNVAHVSSLKDLIHQLNRKQLEYAEHVDIEETLNHRFLNNSLDFIDVKGQEKAKRAVLVSVAGFHNLLFIGPPGSGKSMMAQRIPSILNRITVKECLEISQIYSVAGLLGNDSLMMERPFRAPHHSITNAALIGGNNYPRPGEITLAHKGVLFLDEVAEFKKETIENLRQPLEEKQIVINRAAYRVVFPADFMLVMAMNPCKCGFYPDKNLCNCSEADVSRYFGKIRGPILDRVDICVGTKKLDSEDFKTEKLTMSSEEMRTHVNEAQKIQLERFKNTGISFNSQMGRKEIETYCCLDLKTQEILNKAYEKYNMTARGYYKVLKVARTIADLAGEETIGKMHIMEALSYRNAFVNR